MYRSRLWTMRQFAGFGTAEDTNARFKELLTAGGSGLSTAFDMPTLLGRDSDDQLTAWRGGQSWRRRRHPRGHEDSLFGYRPRQSDYLDDHQLARSDLARDVRGCRGLHRRVTRRAGRHSPKRHLEGVPGSEGIHIPAASLDATRHRRDAVLPGRASKIPPGVHIRIPHPRGGFDCGSGAGVHPR